MFYISKRNKRAFGFFAIAALVVIITPRVLLQFDTGKTFSVSEMENFNRFKEERDLIESQSKDYKRNIRKKRYHAPSKRFDPNLYKSGDWQKLGLSPKQAEVVLKFSSRGLYSNEDLQKIFVIDEELFQLIKDSTYYPEKSFSKNFASTEEQEKIKPKLWLELNEATADDLLKLKGIGPFFSKKIIEYRDKLGGFISKKQLMEVWKFDEEKLAEIEDQIWTDPLRVDKMNINSIEAESLKEHPYISWNIANSITKMREQKGGFKTLEEIMDSKLISQDLFVKLKPYLTL